MKALYSKSTANIKIKVEKLKENPLKYGASHCCSFSPYLVNIALKVLARAVRQLKEIKVIKIEKKEVKFMLFADGVIVYTSDPKNCILKLLQLISSFSNLTGLKIN